MGEFPEQPGSHVLGMCLLTHGHHVHCWLWGRLRENHAWAPFHGLLHPRGTGKNSLLRCRLLWSFIFSTIRFFKALYFRFCVSTLPASDHLSVTSGLSKPKRNGDFPACFLGMLDSFPRDPGALPLSGSAFSPGGNPMVFKKGMVTY